MKKKDFFKSKEEKEQNQAEELGYTDKTEQRIVDTGKPVPPEPKLDNQCVVEGCTNVKEIGQTYVCTQHVRSN